MCLDLLYFDEFYNWADDTYTYNLNIGEEYLIQNSFVFTDEKKSDCCRRELQS